MIFECWSRLGRLCGGFLGKHPVFTSLLDLFSCFGIIFGSVVLGCAFGQKFL